MTLTTTDAPLSAGECAKATGLSLRTLRFWEQLGLIRPQRRPGNGYRFYGASDLERIQQVLFLKRVGLSLTQIRGAMSSPRFDFAAVLRAQADILEARRRDAEAGLSVVRRALSAVESGSRVDLPTLCDLIRTTNMDKDYEKFAPLIERFYTPEQLKALEARRPTDAEQAEISAEWADLIAEANRLVGTDPAAPAAQDLARRWQEMIDAFTGGDPGIAQSLSNMWGHVAANPDIDVPRPFGGEVGAFVQAALAARSGK